MDRITKEDHLVELKDDLNKEKFEDNKAVVRIIDVVIHAVGTYDDGSSRNHVTILLLIDKGRSIQINMRARAPKDGRGILMWSERPWQTSNSEINHARAEVRKGLTVRKIYALLRQNGYHRYRMASSGRGCRFWAVTVMGMLAREDLVHKDAQSAMKDYLRHRYDKVESKGPYPIEIEKGTFLGEREWRQIWQLPPMEEVDGSEIEEGSCESESSECVSEESCSQGSDGE